METYIIGQGYNIKEDTSVGKELIQLFNSHRYKSFTCLVAFASYGGVTALTPYIADAKKHNMQIKIILGIDQEGTSKEALEEVLSWGVDAKIYHTSSANIFHPKVYLFENEDIFSIIVGSNNLTIPGMVKNIECSLFIKDIKSNPVHSGFYKYWKNILDASDANLYTLSKKLIKQMYDDAILPSEIARAAKYDTDVEITPKNANHKFKKSQIQANPEGFIPKRLVRVKRTPPKTNNENVKSLPLEETWYIKDQVLITEIGGGPRWKQVNFPINIFENFFGAKRGNN